MDCLFRRGHAIVSGVGWRVPKSVLINGGLLVLVAAAILAVQVWDRPVAAVETGVRRYATAVTNADLDAAMAEIAPDQRAAWSDFVRHHLGHFFADRFRAAAAAALAFFARATRSAWLIVSRDRRPPIRPPFAPCSRRNSRTAGGNFLGMAHILICFRSLWITPLHLKLLKV